MKKKILSIVLCLCLVLGMLPMAARAAGTYIVTFSANGRGTAPAAQTVADGENAAEPAAPTAVGYAFGGWYTDAGCTAAYNFSAAVAGDLTLYARWTAYSYSVRFALDAGGTLSGAAEQTVAYGGRAASACTVRPDSGYQLAGWRYDYTAADGSQQIGVAAGDTGYASVAVLGDVVFRAVLCRTPFVLAAASNGYVSLASDAAGAADPAVGKTVSDVTENISGSDLPVSAGVRFAPQGENYALASITIRDFQSPVHALTLTGDSDTAASKQLKSGTYSFSTAGSAVQVTVDLAAGTITTDKTIGASIAFDIAYVKIQTSCTVKYYKQNIDRSGYDEAAADRQTEPAAAGAKITFQPRSCAGFRYEAAKTTYADSAHENPQTDALTAKFDGTSVVSLYYDRISSFLSFDVNGRGAAPDAQQLVYGAKASEPAAPTAGGYTFGGWYKEASCVNAWDFGADTMPAANTRLYAKWTENEAAIRYVSADDSMGTVSPASETLGAATGAPAGSEAAAKAGCHFTGWTNAAGAVVSTERKLTPARVGGLNVSAAYTANFAPNAYTVSFAANGGTGGMDPEAMTCGTAQELTPNGFTRAGYTFGGWNTDENGGGTDYADRAAVRDLTAVDGAAFTLYAKWTENEVAIAYASADAAMGTVSLASETLGAATGAPAGSEAAAKAGCHFVSWTNAAGAVVSTEQKLTPARVGGLNVSAAYTANFAANPPHAGSSGGTTVTVPVSSNEGSVKAEASVTDGTASVSVTDAQIAEIASGKTAAGTVRLDVSSLDVTAAVVPARLLAAAEKSASADGVEVELPAGSVALDRAALAAVSAGGADATVSVVRADNGKLTAAQKEALGSQAGTALVFDVSILSGGQKMTALGGGTLRVAVPYVPKAGEDVSKLVVWFVGDDGAIEPKTGAYDGSTGRFTFQTKYLSRYVLVSFPFADVAADSWYYGSAAYAYLNGLFAGTSDTTFSPETAMTRGMLVTVLYRMAGSPEAAASAAFTDVAADSYCAKAAAWAAANKLAAGYGGGAFGPDDPVTREQLAAILYRYAQYKNYDTTQGGMAVREFADYGDISEYALSPMIWAVNAGLIKGAGNRLTPQGNAARAQAAAILRRFCQNLKK